MRLIDLDALPYGRVEWEDIIDAPTVDAVPIDWLICKRNEHNNDGFAWIFEAVIDDWRRENAVD